MHQFKRGSSAITVVFALAFFFSALVFSGWLVTRIVYSIRFDRDITGYLERAAIANTVETAERELGTAVKAIEARGLTKGYTSVIYQTPDEDIGFWYSNLKAAHDELKSISPEAQPLERSNVLMKLRETISRDGSEGTYVILPSGISIFPSNTLAAVIGWGSILGGIFSLICLAVLHRD